jgi:hypothetical protein
VSIAKKSDSDSLLSGSIFLNSMQFIANRHFIVHALQDKNKLNQRMDIPGNIYSGIESANALDCADNEAG